MQVLKFSRRATPLIRRQSEGRRGFMGSEPPTGVPAICVELYAVFLVVGWMGSDVKGELSAVCGPAVNRQLIQGVTPPSPTDSWD